MSSDNHTITCNVFFSGEAGYKAILKKNFKKYNLKFEEVISYIDLENLREPIIYVNFSEDELGFYESKYLTRRKEKNYETIFILFFSEEFFHLLEGEIPSYTTLVDSYRQYSTFPVSTFLEEEIESNSNGLLKYIKTISSYFSAYGKINECEKILEQLDSAIQKISKEDTDDFVYLSLLLNFVREIKSEIEHLQEERNKAKSSFSVLSGEVQKIQESNEKEAVKKYHFYKYEEPSENALINKITLKYGRIFGDIKKFLENVENNYVLKRDTDILVKCKDTRNLLDKICTMAVLGTFSSGKTTFINSLIKSSHKLRTSAAHNSAVLVKLQNAPEQEFYEVEYRDYIKLDIFKSTDFDEIAQIYEDNQELKVIHIDKKTNLIQARNSKSEIVNIDVDLRKNISVKVGDILVYGTKLTEGFNRIHLKDDDEYKINCISKNDISSIIRQIECNCLFDFSIELVKLEEKNLILKNQDCINVLKYLEKYFTEADAHLSSNILITSEAPSALKNTVKVTISGKYKKQNEKVLLNSPNAWQKFCENPNGSIFLESPDCYIFVKEVRLFMKSSFLENCKIVDTPGFGSVTEAHDAISERYLREHRGIMLIMVKIDIHANSSSFVSLINDINRIEKTGSSLKKEKIYFILNCFRNNLTDEVLERKCKEISSVLVKEGFNKKNVFVCNLKASLEKGEYLKTLYGFPSFEEFRIQLLKEIENEGQLMQLDQIRNNWNNYFTVKFAAAKKSLREKQKDERLHKQKYEEACEKLENLNKISFKPFDVFQNEIRKEFSFVTERVENFERKKDFKNEFQKFIDDLERICRNLYDDESITDYYNLIAGEIKMYTDGIINEIPKSERKHFTFPTVAVRGKYKSIMSDSWGIFWHKKDEKLKELADFIESELSQSIFEYKKYYSFVLARLKDIKNNVTASIENDKETYKDNQKLKQAILENEQLIDNLQNTLKKYKEISEEIDSYLLMQKEL